MPDHSSWFNFILPFKELLNWVRDKMGVSLLSKAPVEIQYILGFGFIFFVLFILTLIVRSHFKNLDKALIPEGKLGIRSFFEAMVEGALSQMEGIMDKKAALYFLPLIGTCMFIILFSNLLGLIPGFLPPTSNLNTTLSMSIVIFFATHIYGVKEHGFAKYFAHFFGPIKKWYAFAFMLLFFLIEMISHIARPISLSVRLMGNMFADHMVVATFIGLFPLLLPLPVMVLGTLVCIVQTVVFCILSTVYISMAIAHEEH